MYSIIGTVEQGDRFDIISRNVAGDWMELCCVDGQSGWIYAPLLIVNEVPTSIPLAHNIPTAPTDPTPTDMPVSRPRTAWGVTRVPENRCSPYNDSDWHPAA